VVLSKAFKDLHFTVFGDFDLIAKSNDNWTAQFVSSVVLIPLCVWVYQQVSHKNINKKWVKDFIQKSSGNRVTKSLEFVSELQSLKRDSI